MSRFSTWVLRVLAILAAIAVVSACGDDDDATDGEVESETPASPEASVEPTEIAFVAGFKPQANLPFVGVYVAQEQGFFADEGLEVTIEHDTGGQGEAVRLLVAGEIEFTTADAAVVMQRRSDPGLPLLAVAQIGQTGQQGYAVKEDSGMDSPADWAGKIVGFKGAAAPPDLFAILEANGLSEDDIELVNIGFDPRVFVEGQVDVYPLFLSNEPFTIEQRLNTPITIFEAADYDIPTLGLTYVTSEDYAAEDPEAVEAFLRATLRGISWAAENRDEALAIVEIYAPEEDPELMAFMFDTELEAARVGAGTEGIGLFDDERWLALYELLLEHEGLTEEIDPAAAYDGSFVTEIYAEEP
ncbi:MAG TPA: ABC transporter substrate-binding protein [Dehalococcoidia bacterium]|nr:ABC transporter substrate-binding protein [Dehalococcoidia bacterium]